MCKSKYLLLLWILFNQYILQEFYVKLFVLDKCDLVPEIFLCSKSIYKLLAIYIES